MTVPLPKKQINVLRAIAGAPAGLRSGAYPSMMPPLLAMGLVVEKPTSRAAHASGRAWFLTAEGREAVRAYGADEG